MAKGKYHEWIEKDNLLLIEGWAREGLTDEQIAKNIGISAKTLYEWIKRFSEIGDALKKGKAPVDFEVENALLKRALGFEFEETETIIEEIDGVCKKRVKKIKKMALPEVSAIIFWLKNRKPKHWRKMNSAVEEKLKAETEKLMKEAEALANEMQVSDRVVFVNEDNIED